MSYKAGFVGLIGQPNAGKSTLLNLLVKEKISIVTPKPQTTRRRVLGVISKPEGQIVFVDAPGVVNAKKGLNSFLEQEAKDVIASSDALVGVISLAEKNKKDVESILKLLIEARKPFVVVVTKADIVDKKHRFQVIKEMIETLRPKTPVFEFSSKWGRDINPVLDQLITFSLNQLPETPAPLYDIELFTPHTVRELAAEVIREKCFEELAQEIPYSLTVRIVKFDESNPDLIKIYADIVVGKEGHKAIVIGQRASTIKKIGIKARHEIEKIVDAKVFLKLEVVVRENWSTNIKFMKDLGYVVKSE